MKYKYVYFFIIILFSFELKASKYIDKGYYVIDLENKVEWLKCTVGQYWSDEESKCMGIAKKLNISNIEQINHIKNLEEQILEMKNSLINAYNSMQSSLDITRQFHLAQLKMFRDDMETES